MADGLAHPPDLAVAPLVHDDAQHPGSHHPHSGWCGGTVAQVDAPPETAQRTDGWLALHLHQVLLVHAVRRVRQAVRQLAVVGEQQQALAVGVQAANREHTWLGRNEIDRLRTPLGVGCAADDSGRLVQHVVHEPRCDGEGNPVHGHPVHHGIDPLPQAGLLAVDRYPT